jgi:hypothetical protein
VAALGIGQHVLSFARDERFWGPRIFEESPTAQHVCPAEIWELLEVQTDHRAVARVQFWTCAHLPRETLMLKKCIWNNDEVHDQQCDDLSAHLPRDIAVFAPDQNCKQPQENCMF